MNIEERIMHYINSHPTKEDPNIKWEFIFNGKRAWENVCYMRCQNTGLVLFIPSVIFA
jgi:hypothetical protein